MNPLDDRYVHLTESGGWRVTGTRVSLDTVIHAYLNGEDAETIVRNFSTLGLDMVHGAIAFFLRNREEMNRYLESQKLLWDNLRAESEVRNADLHSKIRERVNSRSAKNIS